MCETFFGRGRKDSGRIIYNVIIRFSKINTEKVDDKLLRLPDGKSAIW